jgi:NADPH-dependent 2,4-dienoyl-CoA reductase/sulfur reductase-like enzyme
VQLSKQPNRAPAELALRDQAYFRRAKINLMLRTDVVSINYLAKNIAYQTLGQQMKSISYDYLVLAMGLRSRKLPLSLPGNQLRNIFYLRTLEDASHVISTFRSAVVQSDRIQVFFLSSFSFVIRSSECT